MSPESAETTNPICSAGPFDIIGDIHGCFDELRELLTQLGYVIQESESSFGYSVSHPLSRRVVFLGDLVDRGPQIVAVLRLVMAMVDRDLALCVKGNHEAKLVRALQGRQVKVTHGLQESLDQIAREPATFRAAAIAFMSDLASHYLLDEGRLVVAHAGLKESMHGSDSSSARAFALYGDTTGERDEFGLPVRLNWASDYSGSAYVVYGHTPVQNSVWQNGTINIDNGCVFGGALTALRYPELELVSVAAAEIYYQPVRPMIPQ